MKKLALALCLLAVSFTAQAQFEKGTTIINPSLSGLDFSYSKNDKAKFGVGAQVGTFVTFRCEDWIRFLLVREIDFFHILSPCRYRTSARA